MKVVLFTFHLSLRLQAEGAESRRAAEQGMGVAHFQPSHDLE